MIIWSNNIVSTFEKLKTSGHEMFYQISKYALFVEWYSINCLFSREGSITHNVILRNSFGMPTKKVY